MSQNEVRTASHGPFGMGNGGYHVDLSGFTQGQYESFLAATIGTQWFTLKEGQPVFVPVHKGFPDPIEDPSMHPHWRPCAGVQLPLHKIEVLFDGPSLKTAFSPSFYISGLCGYGYTPEGYQEQARILRSFGFKCMRSEREEDGKFWEVWYLPGTWAAKGDLENYVASTKAGVAKVGDTVNYEPFIRGVCGFICKRVRLGSLDVVVQRAAAVFRD